MRTYPRYLRIGSLNLSQRAQPARKGSASLFLTISTSFPHQAEEKKREKLEDAGA